MGVSPLMSFEANLSDCGVYIFENTPKYFPPISEYVISFLSLVWHVA